MRFLNFLRRRVKRRRNWLDDELLVKDGYGRLVYKGWTKPFGLKFYFFNLS